MAETSNRIKKGLRKTEKAFEKAIDATEDVAEKAIVKTKDVAKKTIREIEEQTEKIYDEIKELKEKAGNKAQQVKRDISKDVKQVENKISKEVKKISAPKSQQANKLKGGEASGNLGALSGLMQFKDWEKINLRVARIKKAEDIEGADKLYKLTLDVGELGTKVACAGVKEHYTKEELKGKKIIYFANLTPRMLKGINSQGMILAAVSKDNSQVVLIQPDKDIDVGARVS